MFDENNFLEFAFIIKLFILQGPLIKERNEVHEDPTIHEDIEIAVVHGGNWGEECKPRPNLLSVFTDVRLEVILNWIMQKVPDVFVTGNSIYFRSNIILKFLPYTRL